MHGAEFGAAVKRGYGFARVQQAFGIEGMFQRVELLEFGRLELLAHRIDFLHAHAVFAGDGSAGGDAQAENVGAELLGPLQFTLEVGIVEDQRVKISVSCMKHIGDLQPVLFGKLGDLRKYHRQFASRYRAIHAVVVGPDAPDGGKRVFTACPQPEAFGFIGGYGL